MSNHRYEHLQAILERLKLTRVPERLDQLAEEAAKASWTYVEFLDRVLDVEVSARVERDVTMKTRLARFPFVKTLDQFDFSFQPALNEAQIRELAAARFVAHGENILLLGPPGVGKTHLAVSLGVAAIKRGASFSPVINRMGNGATWYRIMSWPRRCWTACCISQRPLTFEGKVT